MAAAGAQQRRGTMGYWIEILKLGAEGKTGEARDLLEELPDVLMSRVRSAAKRFINTLATDWRALGSFYEDDLVNSILADVALSVEETLVLVELVNEQPQASLADIVSIFPWKEGYKRSDEQKRKRIADYLQSMSHLGIRLPPSIQTMVGGEGESLLEFDEVKYATSSNRIRQSWDGLKTQLGLDTEIGENAETKEKIYGRLASIDDPDTNTRAAAEKADYGRIYMRTIFDYPTGTIFELNQLGKELGPDVTAIMEAMHAAKPKQGFRPISWHYVFWILSEEYENLLLAIECVDPLCRTEDRLAEHIAQHYTDVVGTSRSTIVRRRDRLYRACEDRIHERMRERFQETNPQMSA